MQLWIDEDRRAGLPVDQYDYSDVLEELNAKDSKITFDKRLDQLPLGIQKAYQMGGVSQSSGERWEKMGIAIASPVVLAAHVHRGGAEEAALGPGLHPPPVKNRHGLQK